MSDFDIWIREKLLSRYPYKTEDEIDHMAEIMGMNYPGYSTEDFKKEEQSQKLQGI